MFGHGFSMLFLSCVYGQEPDGDLRKELGKVLAAACRYSRKAQTSRGGWGYVSARDGSDFDEGCVTIVQIQALRAARQAGIPMPPEVLPVAVITRLPADWVIALGRRRPLPKPPTLS